MPTRRKFLAAVSSGAVCLFATALPYTVGPAGLLLELVPQAAFAKSGENNGNGGGGGGGNGGGNAGGNGGGNGGGRSGKDNSSGGNVRGNSKGAGGGASRVGVRHSDGMSEEISGGRYIMKDARGRTIINRTATLADLKRIQSLIH